MSRIPKSLHARRRFGRAGELYVISEPPRPSVVERLGVRLLLAVALAMAVWAAGQTWQLIEAVQALRST